MYSLISAYGMEGYVNGQVVEHKKFIEGKPNPEHSLWSRVKGVIKSWIYASIFSSMIRNVAGKHTASDMWQSFE